MIDTTSLAPARLGLAAMCLLGVEESFQSSKELAGPGQHQVRTWTSWHRWTALAVLAHAFLTVTPADQTPAPYLGSASVVLPVRTSCSRIR